MNKVENIVTIEGISENRLNGNAFKIVFKCEGVKSSKITAILPVDLELVHYVYFFESICLFDRGQHMTVSLSNQNITLNVYELAKLNPGFNEIIRDSKS